MLINSYDARHKPSDVTFDKLTSLGSVKYQRFEQMNKNWGEKLGENLRKLEC
jgi:hypothetical protein